MQSKMRRNEVLKAEIVVETPFKSLRKTVNLVTKNGEGLVRLTSSNGRLKLLDENPLNIKNRKFPVWLKLREKARESINYEVSA